MLKNPVMLVVEVGAVFLSIKLLLSIFIPSAQSSFGFEIQITLWLWFTVLFANFAEAMAEGRGKAQADTLRKAKTETNAKLIKKDGSTEIVAATELRVGDIVYVEVETVGETIEANEMFGTVEAVKTTSDLFMPLTFT